MKFSLSFVLIALSAFPLASAHGLVTKIVIGNNEFPGNRPAQPTNPSIIREITDPSPVKGANNPSINCGTGAPNAALFASAAPGDTIKFAWTGVDLSNWPHNTGPMFTYMANCGSTTCDKFDTRDAKWFKIQQIGRTAKGQPWAQQALMSGSTADITLPDVAPGNYIIRHEILALHLANSAGGAEWYPSCAQIQVTGSGTGVPKDSELVSFPGAYSDNDPGIFTQSAFDVNADYPFPGPPIASFVTDGGAPPTGNSAATTAPASSSHSTANPAKPQSTGVSGGAGSANNAVKSSGSCKLVKKRSVVNRPRHLSRIMRDLNLRRSFH